MAETAASSSWTREAGVARGLGRIAAHPALAAVAAAALLGTTTLGFSLLVSRAGLFRDAWLAGVVAGVAFAVAACVMILSDRPRVHGPALAFGALAVASVAWSATRRDSLDAGAFLALCLVAYACVSQLRTDRARTLVLATLVACAALQGAVAIAQQVVSAPNPPSWLDHEAFPAIGTRSTGTVYGPNRLGAFLVLALPAALALTTGHSRWARAARYGPVGLIGLGLVFTYSRAAWVGALVALGVWVVVSRRGARRRQLAVGSIVLAVVAGSMLAYPPTRQRALSPLLGTDSALTWRIAVWRDALGVIGERPLLGAGLDAFPEARLSHLNPISAFLPCQQAHNELLGMAADLGLVGAAAFAFLVGAALWRGIAMLRGETGSPLAAVSVAAMAGLLVTGIFESTLNARYWPVIAGFWILLGLLASLHTPEPRRVPRGRGERSLEG